MMGRKWEGIQETYPNEAERRLCIKSKVSEVSKCGLLSAGFQGCFVVVKGGNQERLLEELAFGMCLAGSPEAATKANWLPGEGTLWIKVQWPKSARKLRGVWEQSPYRIMSYYRTPQISAKGVSLDGLVEGTTADFQQGHNPRRDEATLIIMIY